MKKALLVLSILAVVFGGCSKEEAKVEEVKKVAEQTETAENKEEKGKEAEEEEKDGEKEEEVKKYSSKYEKIVDKEAGLTFERNVAIEMRDGVKLYGNVFRPIEDGNYPVIVSMGPYGKDDLPAHYDPEEDGDINVSKYTAFEVVDPQVWVEKGYVVVNVDSRGVWNSGGDLSVFSDKEAEDYYDIIEWAGTADWSNGNVGTAGVSYFAISQWRAAELAPPHLKAILPWEGFTDLYRDGVYHGGVQEEGFLEGWYGKVSEAKTEGSTPEDFIGKVKDHILLDEVYKERTPDLSKIKVPALVVASWGDHGLHTRGTIEGFKGIASKDKWLYVYGKKKWESFYSDWGVEIQQQFFDHYLKGEENGMKDEPKVRYAVRNKFYDEEIKKADNYPLAGTEYEKLYLNASDNTLNEEEVAKESQTVASNENRFTYTFEEDTTLVGGMTLKTFISANADDADLFVGVEKYDASGKQVYFQGNDTNEGHVASGWLRLSQRKLDKEKSNEERIVLAHDEVQKLTPNEVVEASVEILPSGTKFKKGDKIAVVIGNHDLKGAGEVEHITINKAETPINIHTGGKYKSYLQIPVVK